MEPILKVKDWLYNLLVDHVLVNLMVLQNAIILVQEELNSEWNLLGWLKEQAGRLAKSILLFPVPPFIIMVDGILDVLFPPTLCCSTYILGLFFDDYDIGLSLIASYPLISMGLINFPFQDFCQSVDQCLFVSRPLWSFPVWNYMVYISMDPAAGTWTYKGNLQDLKDFARQSGLDVVYSEVGRERDGRG